MAHGIGRLQHYREKASILYGIGFVKAVLSASCAGDNMNIAQSGVWPAIVIKNQKNPAKLHISRDYASDHTLGLVDQVRKALILSVLVKDSVQELTDLFQKRWQERRKNWNKKKDICLYNEMTELLTGCACEWAGIALPSVDFKKRANEFIAAGDNSGRKGLHQLRAQYLRIRSEQWAQSLIRQVRSGKLSPPAHSALYRIAFYREPIFHLSLNASAAATELLNILRPLVIASRHMALSARTVHRYPEYRSRLDNEVGQEIFIQEVILKDNRYADVTLTSFMMKEFFKTWLSLGDGVQVSIPNLELQQPNISASQPEQSFKFNFNLEDKRPDEYEIA